MSDGSISSRRCELSRHDHWRAEHENRTGKEPQRSNLPVLKSVLDIASQMKISQAELRNLAFGKILYGVEHYQHFQVAKRNGGVRQVSSPSADLRRAQLWILHNILSAAPVHDAAMAYRIGRSIVDNARIHSRKGIVVRVDIQDFFPSIVLRRVRSAFLGLGYNQEVALPLTLLTTSGDGASVRWHLPQGAPSSPALSNLVCLDLDKLLSAIAEERGFDYSRYADDLVFSHSDDDVEVGHLLRKTREILKSQGFNVNDAKTRVMRSKRRQTVTGVVVNDEPRVSRQDLRRFRAFLHRCEIFGFERVSKEIGKNAKAYAIGYVSYVSMVNSNQALRLFDQYPWLKNAPNNGRK